MASPTNPTTTQSQAQQLTPAEVRHFLTDVMNQTSDQFSPGKLAINSVNGDVLQRWVREKNPPAVTVVKTLLESRNYAQAVKTLVSEYVRAVKALMFDNPPKLSWEKVHPAILKRRQLEAEQRGAVKPGTDEEGRTKWVQVAEKAKADDAEAKLEAKYEKDVAVLIDKIFFANVRSQQRDERKIADLQEALRADVAAKRKNGATWGKLHAYVVTEINKAYQTDERERERWNSR